MTIINAAPMSLSLGIEDLSKRKLAAVADQLPQHLPKVYAFAKWGPETPQLVVGNSRNNMYHVDSFDYTKPYANHATVLSNVVNAQGNAQMFQRIIPSDAGNKAYIRLYLEVVQSYEPDYVRGADGKYMTDGTGAKIPTGSRIPVRKLAWVSDDISIDYDGNGGFGQAITSAGSMMGVDQAGNVSQQATRFPIMDLEVSHFGAEGNNFGIRLWAPTESSNMPINPTILEDEEVAAYPYRIAAIHRTSSSATPKAVASQYAEQFIDFSFKPGAVNRKLEKEMYIGKRFLQEYQLLNQEGFPNIYGPFGRMKIYTDHLATIHSMLYFEEIKHLGEPGSADIDGLGNVDGELAEVYRLNIVSGVNSHDVPYYTFRVESSGSDGFIRLTENTNIYARGGNDGTMDGEMFNQLVGEAVAEYANPLSSLLDTAVNVERIIYDTGFDLETKYELIKFISQRKDTFVWLSCHVDGEPQLTASEESSLAVALRTRLQMYPESDYFGTPIVRGLVMGRSGTLIDSKYDKELPVTIEMASKAAAYMGAGNGKWTAGESYDHGDDAVLTMFKDVNVTFTPAAVRNKDWSNGLNWVQSYTRRGLFVPALKTAYDDDTSVLNSFFTAMVCCELQAVGERAWRKYSGVTSLTREQLKERIEKFVKENTEGRFDGTVFVEPEVYFTDDDLARGYSWHLAIKLYANNMMTVQTLYLQAFRMEDLESAAA